MLLATQKKAPGMRQGLFFVPQLVMGKWLHRLSDIDPETCTATCAVCGEVDVVGATGAAAKGRWKCGDAFREKRDAYDAKRREERRENQPPWPPRPSPGPPRSSLATGGGVRRTHEDVRRWARREGLLGTECETCGDVGDLVADHCHIEMRFRGTLCHRCNIGISWFQDDPARLRDAALYLERERR